MSRTRPCEIGSAERLVGFDAARLDLALERRRECRVGYQCALDRGDVAAGACRCVEQDLQKVRRAGCSRSPRCSTPILYPDLPRYLDITHEEIGALSGISRQNANQYLKRLERDGLLRLEYGEVTIIDLERLRAYGE